MNINDKIKRLGGKTAAAASIGLTYLAFQARYRRDPDKLSALLDNAYPVVKFTAPGFAEALHAAYTKAGGFGAFIRAAAPGAEDAEVAAAYSAAWRLMRHVSGAKFDTRREKWTPATCLLVDALKRAGIDINDHLQTPQI